MRVENTRVTHTDCPACHCPMMPPTKCGKSVCFAAISRETAFWFRGLLCHGWEATGSGNYNTSVFETGATLSVSVSDMVIPEPRAKVVFDG